MDYFLKLPLKQKLLAGLFLVLIISIPAVSFLVKQRTSFKSDASTDFPTQQGLDSISSSSGTITKAKDDLKKQIADLTNKNASPAPESSDSTSAYSFGTTLNFKLSIEGKKAAQQKAKIFVGLAQGDQAVTNPSYLLSFTPETNDDGSFTGLSLAGLTINNTYIAYLKGPTQLATSSAFIVRPAEANLNNGEAINMLTGDLNDDNKIDTEDYDLLRPFLGLTSKSSGWKEDYDFNQDEVINLVDISYIVKNMNKVGAGNIYTSTVATTSAILTPASQGSPSAGAVGGIGGYWMWVPKIK